MYTLDCYSAFLVFYIRIWNSMDSLKSYSVQWGFFPNNYKSMQFSEITHVSLGVNTETIWWSAEDLNQHFVLCIISIPTNNKYKQPIQLKCEFNWKVCGNRGHRKLHPIFCGNTCNWPHCIYTQDYSLCRTLRKSH